MPLPTLSVPYHSTSANHPPPSTTAPSTTPTKTTSSATTSSKSSFSLPTWSQTKTTSKAGFDRVYRVVDKLGAPINRLSNKVGSEAFWPTTLDKESEKAARILRSFCKDGFYVEEKVGDTKEGSEAQNTTGTGVEGVEDGKEPEDGTRPPPLPPRSSSLAGGGDPPSKMQDPNVESQSQGKKKYEDGVPRAKQRVLKKIPTQVIKKAKGLAIFTTMRTGLWVSGAGGSGVLVARMPNGEWSPPSGIMLHTAGLGFLVGVDIYDCVVVINTEQALEAFTKIRCTLGGEVSAVAGPVGMGGVLETEVHKRQAPVWNYLKSRGFYAGVQIDGTVIIERTDENERFYGERIPVADILAGKARHPPREIGGLMNTIKAAQGDTDIDENALPSAEPTPGDYEIQNDVAGFGLPPDEDDPDPYGVRALEEQGMVIREAGTGSRPSMEAFTYKPSPSSPIYATFHSRKSSKRDSARMSVTSVNTMSDRGTQTDDLPTSPRFSDSPRFTDSPRHGDSPRFSDSPRRGDPPLSPRFAHSPPPSEDHSPSPVKEVKGEEPSQKDGAAEVDDEDDGEESPVEVVNNVQVQEARKPAMTVVSKAKMVTIPKRLPPALPPRSPFRSSGFSDTGVPRSPSPRSEEQKGLGIDVPDAAPQTGEHDLQKMVSNPGSIDERLEQVHLVPSQDMKRLSPGQDGFERASLSGSEYSKPTQENTPAEGPTPAEELDESTGVMEDREEIAKPAVPVSDSEADLSKGAEGEVTAAAAEQVNGKQEGEPAAVQPSEENATNTAKDDDDFHSLPPTPAERPHTPIEKEKEAEDETPKVGDGKAPVANEGKNDEAASGEKVSSTEQGKKEKDDDDFS